MWMTTAYRQNTQSSRLAWF